MKSFARARSGAIEYPSSDGKPMAETELHVLNLLNTIHTLRQYFRADENVYVAGNMLMYYVEGDKHRHVSPDIFVVRNLKKHLRPNYLVWEEGKAPDFIIELTSKSTRNEDQKKKFELYRDTLKVAEYFLFDPFSSYLKPALQGFRLVRGRYARIHPVEARLPSKVLGLHLEQDGDWLRVFNPETQEHLLGMEQESAARLSSEAARAESEAALAESEAARAESEAALAESEAARAESEAARAESEAARAQSEAALVQSEAARAEESAAREQAELELERLRNELRLLQKRNAD